MKRLLTIILLLLSIVAKAQTIHIIVFCATNDKKKGVLTDLATSAKNTKQYFEREFVPDVKKYSGYSVSAHYYYDSQFNKTTLDSVVNNLYSSGNDVIFFYYCGHGFNETSSSRQYPKLSLGGMDGTRSKWLEDVYYVLRQKNHRLLITIAEACNKVYEVQSVRNGPGSFGPHSTYSKNAANYNKLFSQSGDYLCSSSKREQASWFDNGWGYFTDCFINAFNRETSEITSSPSWDNIFATTTLKTHELAYQNGEDQTPQWKYDKKGDAASPDAIAQYNQGISYYNVQNYTEAVKCFRIAANQGCADAQFWLGYCYLKGLGEEHNDDYIALLWLEKSAEQGNAKAQYCIGWCYENGRGRKIDKETAMQWYRKSAAQGYEKAIQKLR